MSTKHVIARNVIWNWAGTLSQAAVAFLVVPFLVHRLGQTTYGLWILVGSISSYFGLLDLGVRGSVGRYIAFHRAENDQKAVNATVSTAMAMLCTAALVVLALRGGIRAIFFRAFEIPPSQEAEVRLALDLVCLNLALTFPLSLFDGALWASQRFDILNAIEIPGALARAGLTFVLIDRGQGIVGLAWMTLLITILVSLAKMAANFVQDPALRIGPAHVTRAAARQLFGYGLVSLMMSVARMTRLQLTPMLIGALISPAAVTLYSIGKRFVDYVEGFLVSATGVLTPVATALQAQGESDRQHALHIAGGRLSTAFSLFALVFFLLLGRPLIVLWMGHGWAHAADLLLILALGEVIPFSQSVTGNMLLGMARHKILAGVMTAELVLIGGLAVALRGVSGLTGVCLALAVAAGVCRGAVVVVLGCRVIGVPVRSYLRRALVPALGAAALPALALALAVLVRTPACWPEFLAYMGVYGLLCAAAGSTLLGLDLARLPFRKKPVALTEDGS